jgi:cytoskeletal protein RodZ
MKKTLILILAFVMVVSAGMGFAAAEDPADDSTAVDTPADDGTTVDTPADDGTTVNDPADDGNKEQEVTIITIEKKIIIVQAIAAARAAAVAQSAAQRAAAQRAAAQRAAAAKTIPMQKAGLPILPGILSTLMIGSGLLYGRLRN